MLHDQASRASRAPGARRLPDWPGQSRLAEGSGRGPRPGNGRRDLCNSNRFDLVMAPASRRSPFRLIRSSFRARLLRRTRLPLWTTSEGLSPSFFDRSFRTIACLVDFEDDAERTLPSVAALARRLNARLRVLSVVPPIDDGTMAEVRTSTAPLTVPLAVNRILNLVGDDGIDDVQVAAGTRGAALRLMLGRGDVDLLVLGRRQALAGMFERRLARDLESLPCPVLCIDGASMGQAGWTFEEPHALALSARGLLAPAALGVH